MSNILPSCSSTGKYLTTSTEQGVSTPPHHPEQPAPTLTSAEVRRYQWQQEEGYDLPDSNYERWLESVGARPEGVATSDAGEADLKSSCQSGEWGHPRARQWVGCDQCSHWYRCLCMGLRHKKAAVLDFTCLACLSHT